MSLPLPSIGSSVIPRSPSRGSPAYQFGGSLSLPTHGSIIPPHSPSRSSALPPRSPTRVSPTSPYSRSLPLSSTYGSPPPPWSPSPIYGSSPVRRPSPGALLPGKSYDSSAINPASLPGVHITPASSSSTCTVINIDVSTPEGRMYAEALYERLTTQLQHISSLLQKAGPAANLLRR